MHLKGKKVLVIGLKKTGLAVIDALEKSGAFIIAYDAKNIEELPRETVENLRDRGITCCYGREPDNLESIDLIVVSPGVPLNIPLLQKAAVLRRETIGEVELAFRLGRGRYIGITGTNGKTTTTALTGAILKSAGFKAETAGNIGEPLIEKALAADDETWLVTELSSFQLETIRDFRPEIGAILNLSPDHLDRHGTFENYAEAKQRITLNQGPEDYFIYNADDPKCREIAEKAKSKPIAFSGTRTVGPGAFVSDGVIMLSDENGRLHQICPVSRLKIKGDHNVENALAAAAMSYFAGVPVESIGRALESFPGVAHRLEFIGEVDGISFVNDSKGTNPDSSVKAVKAIDTPIILIAGGYDKSASFEEFVDAFKGKVKALVLMGETAEAIKRAALATGLKEIYIEPDMEAAVKHAFGLGEKGDTVLLSPACASWDMYENFEQRGDDFRSKVEELKKE